MTFHVFFFFPLGKALQPGGAPPDSFSPQSGLALPTHPFSLNQSQVGGMGLLGFF